MLRTFTKLFRRAAPALVGVDMAASSVKVVELSQGAPGTLRLERYAIEPLEPGAIADGDIAAPEQVAAALGRALRHCGSKARQAALALPARAVIARRIMLPAGLSEEEYEFQVEAEASRYIPFPIEEVNLDFQILGPADDQQGEVEVLLAASRREKLVDRVAVAEMAGLEPVVVDAEPHALRAAADRIIALLPEAGHGRVVAVVSIGQSTTELTVVLDGQTLFEREQGFGGQQLTVGIARAYGLTLAEAETRKRAGELPEGFREELLREFLEQGASDIARALQFFFTSTPYARVDQILLAGGTAALPGVVEAVAQRTDTPTALLDPFREMEVSDTVRRRQLQQDAPSLLVATGLAMRGFDA